MRSIGHHPAQQPLRLIGLALLFLLLLFRSSELASLTLSTAGNVALTKMLRVKDSSLEQGWGFLSFVYLQEANSLTPEQVRLVGRAGDFFARALALDSTNGRAWLGVGRVEAFQGNLEEADEAYQQIFDNEGQGGQDVVVLEEAAQVASLLGEDKKAASLWQLASSGQGPYRAGLHYWEQQRFLEALREFQLAVAARPTNGHAQYYLCNAIKVQDDDPQAALPHCEAAVQLDNQNPYYHQGLATTLAQLGEMERAIVEARKAVGLGDQAAAYRTLGKLLLDHGEVLAAEEALLASVQREPTAWAYYWLGITYQAIGAPSKAVSAWRQALVLDPGYGPALSALRQEGTDQ